MNLNPLKHLFDDSGKPNDRMHSFLDRTLRVQRPVATAAVKRLRKEHPEETPQQIAERIEKIYVRTSTGTGAAVGGIAAVPGIGTVLSMGASIASVGGYLEATALYAQAMAELHGVSTEDPERSRAMVMALMLGEDGDALMKQVTASAGGSRGVSSRWGMMLGSASKSDNFDAGRTLRTMFIKRFLQRQSTAFLGRAMPFGIGAVVGGGANLAMSKAVVRSTHEAFGELPSEFPPGLSLSPRAGSSRSLPGKAGKGKGKRDSAGEIDA